MSDRTRRDFLARGVAGLGALSLGGCAPTPTLLDPDDEGLLEDEAWRPVPDTGAEWEDTAVSFPSSCGQTTDFAEGPYYRSGAPARVDLRTLGESGTAFTLSATVRSSRDCRLLSDAVVEIWHVKQDGVYDMTTSDMHYRTRFRVGFSGAFEITTLKPIAYPVEDNRMMPSHFHARINAEGHRELVTQLRFTNDPYDDGTCPPELMMSATVNSDGSEAASFDFVLEAAN